MLEQLLEQACLEQGFFACSSNCSSNLFVSGLYSYPSNSSLWYTWPMWLLSRGSPGMFIYSTFKQPKVPMPYTPLLSSCLGYLYPFKSRAARQIVCSCEQHWDFRLLKRCFILRSTSMTTKVLIRAATPNITCSFYLFVALLIIKHYTTLYFIINLIWGYC